MRSASVPGITKKAFTPVNDHLGAKSRVFEWGSGHSTLYFNRVAGEVVTIEHNQKWYWRTLYMLAEADLTVDGIKLIGPDARDGSTFLSSRADGCFERYVNAINEHPDLYFDLVFIDGRARRHCILAAITKVKSGGLLVIDNSEREEYQEAISFLSGWQCSRHKGRGFNFPGIWETGIWRRP